MNHRTISIQTFFAVTYELARYSSTPQARLMKDLDELDEQPTLGTWESAGSRLQRANMMDGMQLAKDNDLRYRLATCRARRQSDPRDAIYAKLGLATEVFGIVSFVNYQSSVEDVFVAFVRAHVREKKDLSIICMSYPATSTMNLPSWVPDWTVLASSTQLVDEMQPSRHADDGFEATGAAACEASFGDDGRVPEVNGMRHACVVDWDAMSPLLSISTLLPIAWLWKRMLSSPTSRPAWAASI